MYSFVLKVNNVFGKGKGKILECFYRKKELYFSEVMRKANLTQNTTLKHLKALQDLDIIHSQKRAANIYYSLNTKNPLIIPILSYFDLERLNSIEYERKNAILDFIKEISLKPSIVIVFGSTAKNAEKTESDIDMYLVYNKKESKDRRLHHTMKAIYGISLHTFIIDYSYFKEQAIKQEDNVLIHAIKTGFVVLGHKYFYDVILDEKMGSLVDR